MIQRATACRHGLLTVRASRLHKDGLIVRLDPDATDAALKRPHAKVFDLTGRPMKGWSWSKAPG
jgi:hypothetical protein